MLLAEYDPYDYSFRNASGDQTYQPISTQNGLDHVDSGFTQGRVGSLISSKCGSGRDGSEFVWVGSKKLTRVQLCAQTVRLYFLF